MNYYNKKTDFLKSLSLDEAYSFLLENKGWLHNSEIDVSEVIGEIEIGTETHFFKKSFNKNNPRLVGCHESKEIQLLLKDCKPLIVNANYNLDENAERLVNYEKEDGLIAIDRFYIDLYNNLKRLSNSVVCLNNDYSSVLGTILGYPKDAINYFLARLSIYRLSGNLKVIGYNLEQGLFDEALGLFSKSTLPEKNNILRIYDKIDCIYYYNMYDQKDLEKLLKELKSFDLLSNDFVVVPMEKDLSEGIDFLLTTKETVECKCIHYLYYNYLINKNMKF